MASCISDSAFGSCKFASPTLNLKVDILKIPSTNVFECAFTYKRILAVHLLFVFLLVLVQKSSFECVKWSVYE